MIWVVGMACFIAGMTAAVAILLLGAWMETRQHTRRRIRKL